MRVTQGVVLAPSCQAPFPLSLWSAALTRLARSCCKLWAGVKVRVLARDEHAKHAGGARNSNKQQ